MNSPVFTKVSLFIIALLASILDTAWFYRHFGESGLIYCRPINFVIGFVVYGYGDRFLGWLFPPRSKNDS